MRTNFDVGALGHTPAARSPRPHLHRPAVVVPLAPDMRAMARRAVADGTAGGR
jgi:hypothetical protein